jgi:pyruvate,water dikinase
VLATAQPAYDQVLRLAAGAGRPDLGGKVLAGLGSHTELESVSDLWSLSRNEITLDQFLARHGFHGPYEGELSSHPWREDPTPVEEIRKRYAATPESESPMEQQRRLAAESAAARAELMAAVQRSRRLQARLVLGFADRYVGYRGLGKATFVQALDSCRAVARRIGALLAEDGALEDPEDVFYLTSRELIGDDRSVAEKVPERREWRAQCEALVVPGAWHGRPSVSVAHDVVGADSEDPLSGIGASPGVIEGRVRVVTDPTFAEVEPGEILVAPVTDPAWAPIMFVSSALVVEIGGLLSHAAVVAREMGIPCVMGIADATNRLHTGDLCRINGDAGTVEILERVEA